MATPWSKLKVGWHADMKKNQDRVLQAIRRGDFIRPELRSVRLTHPKDPSLEAIISVWTDALKLGVPGDSVRVTVSHRTQQAIADMLGFLMPTARLLDVFDNTAIEKLEPGNWLKTEGAPSGLSFMEADDRSIEQALAGHTKPIVSPGTPWKTWINSRRLANPQNEILGRRLAINYGGYTAAPATPPGVPGPKRSVSAVRNVWQEPGGFHDIDHVDESQKAWFVHRMMTVMWHGIADLWDTEKVARHPSLSWLVSHEGPIEMRHPFLPVCKSLDEGGACTPFGDGGGGGVPPVPNLGTKRFVASAAVIGMAGGLVYALKRWL